MSEKIIEELNNKINAQAQLIKYLENEKLAALQTIHELADSIVKYKAMGITLEKDYSAHDAQRQLQMQAKDKKILELSSNTDVPPTETDEPIKKPSRKKGK